MTETKRAEVKELTDLLEKAHYASAEKCNQYVRCDGCPYEGSDRCRMEIEADYLITNGVTIRKSTKAKPRRRKHKAITDETFLAMEKIGQQAHKGGTE